VAKHAEIQAPPALPYNSFISVALGMLMVSRRTSHCGRSSISMDKRVTRQREGKADICNQQHGWRKDE
jgi:hypothetical protein